MNFFHALTRRIRRIALAIGVLVVCLIATTAVAAAPIQQATPHAPSAGITDAEELEAFLDDLLT
jgi:hypothetical protein